MAEPKKVGQFFTHVRERGETPQAGKAPPIRQGHLGQLMNLPMEKYLELHPGMACRWEHMPSDQNMSLVSFREAQGYHVVDASELKPTEQSSQKTGPIRKGDLILMACPEEVQAAILAQDAEVAENDYRTPERTYKDAMADKQYRTGDGTKPGAAFGKIVRTTEESSADEFVEVSPTGKGGGDTK